MADLTTAKKGERVTLKGGKVVISDGKGGGRVDRPKKTKRVRPSKPTKNKPKPKTKPAETTVQRGLRAVANQGSTLERLAAQAKRK